MTDHERKESIVRHAQQAVQAVVPDALLFDPSEAATSLAMALGYYCATFGFEPAVMCTIISEATRKLRCPHCCDEAPGLDLPT